MTCSLIIFLPVYNNLNSLVAEKLQESRDVDGKKIWTCVDCGFERHGRWDVSRHVEQKHLGLTMPCNYCNATFTRRDKLRSHLKHKHDLI